MVLTDVVGTELQTYVLRKNITHGRGGSQQSDGTYSIVYQKSVPTQIGDSANLASQLKKQRGQ